MTAYTVAIPCWGPPARLLTKTLPMLLGGDVPSHVITLYVHGVDPHRPEYEDIARSLGMRVVLNSGRGLRAQRDLAIADQPAGANVVAVCDDVSAIVVNVDGRLRPVVHVDGMLRAMFVEAHAVGAHLWGVSPTANPRAMTGPGVGLRFVFGSLYGFVNRPGHPANRLTTSYKEDYERSLMHWHHDGLVYRNTAYALRTQIRQASGGIGRTEARRVAEQAESEALMASWPGLVRWNAGRASGFPEILLSAKKPKEPATP